MVERIVFGSWAKKKKRKKKACLFHVTTDFNIGSVGWHFFFYFSNIFLMKHMS
jgi:hypothetical protein